MVGLRRTRKVEQIAQHVFNILLNIYDSVTQGKSNKVNTMQVL